ncbi:hypothetical protein [Cohnella sp. GbtcB17]|uniref:hypothetical protein n=1 Tax=Cohnella sp. GbtcB17 TaxID=2824762 RepID=UPI001C30659E|nr:hypothetical protein [Cohnella sp. GbtcB17]
MFKFNRANKAAAADYIQFGGKQVAIPKLTIAKWKLLFEHIESLPMIIINVLAARRTADFTATVVASLGMTLDEIVRLTAVLTELEPEWIEDNVTHDELIEFLTRTASKNNLQDAAKKFRAALGKWKAPGAANDPLASPNGSSTAPSDSA